MSNLITKFESFQSDTKHRLTSPEDIKKFMLAGKAIFTLESTRTGRWFTYQIRKKVFKSKDEKGEEIQKIFYFVNLLTGPQNTSDYAYLGTLTPNFYLKLTKKSKITPDALSYKALNFFVSLLRKNQLHDEINFYHEGICGKCGKTLTTPESVACGLGPICRGYDKPTKSDERKKKLQRINRKIMDKK